jgi:pyridoxal phosphate enzyme (YggS family)
MFPSYEEFAARAAAVRTQIDAACRASGRDPRGVELLAVTKNHPAAAAEHAARHGLRAVGENRVREGVEKKARTAAPVAWELIGHLQSNKARLAAAHFDRVQSVDGEKLIALPDRAAAETGRVLPVLLQINAGADPDKFGAGPAAAPHLLETALAAKNLRVDGLMTIAPLSGDPEAARRTFARLRSLRDELARASGAPLAVLSMGMSDDLADAIAEGSTLVRVGRALFGERG